jgi:hypothetical protein
LPRRPRNEKTGISSYQESLVEQRAHFDLPLATLLPVLSRSITTFRKLPIIRPRPKIIIGKKIIHVYYITQKSLTKQTK